MLRSVCSFLPHLALDQTFLNDRTMALLQQEGVEPPDSVAVFRNLLAAAAEKTSAPGDTSATDDTVKRQPNTGFAA